MVAPPNLATPISPDIAMSMTTDRRATQVLIHEALAEIMDEVAMDKISITAAVTSRRRIIGRADVQGPLVEMDITAKDGAVIRGVEDQVSLPLS